MKVALNRDFGGFGLSKEAYEKLGLEWDNYGYLSNEDLGIKSDDYHAYRSDSRLIAVIEELGEKASGSLACVHIVEIPDDVQWEISEYDGRESVEEIHRSW